MIELYYNFHDLVKIRIDCNKKYQSDFFNNNFSFFKDEPTKRCDIIINFSEFHLDKHDLLQINKYLIIDGDVFYRGYRKFVYWDLCVKNLCSKTTEIMFNGNKLSLKYLLFYILEPIINYYLLQQGYCLIHSSCLFFNGRGYLINAYPGGGKTSVALKMLKNGADFLSEEMTIISKNGNALSYPLPLSLFDYNLNRFPLKGFGYSLFLKIYIYKSIRILTKGLIKPPLYFDLNEIFKETNIVDKIDIYEIYILTHRVDESPKNMTNFIDELLKINKKQFKFFEQMRQSYINEIEHSGLKNYWDSVNQIFSQCLKNCKYKWINDPDTLYTNILIKGK